jgi:bacterioferritin
MKGDPRVIDYLNRALRSELTAVSQYWVHFRLAEDWGFTKLAKKERQESIEEMRHADRLIARIVFLEGHPNLQVLDPLRIGTSIVEILKADLAAEHDARALYTEARAYCRDVKDYVSMELFQDLLEDEEDHINFIETQLRLVDSIGEPNFGQLNADSADAEEDHSD